MASIYYDPQYPVLFQHAAQHPMARCSKRGRVTGAGIVLQCIRMAGHEERHLMDIPFAFARPMPLPASAAGTRCNWLARCTNTATRIVFCAVGAFAACDTCTPRR